MNIGKNFLMTKRIDLGLEFGAEKPEDFHITFSELETGELMQIKTSGNDKTIDVMLALLGRHIVEHNATDEAEKEMSNDALWKIIRQKSIAATKIFREYSEWIADPFQSETEQK